MDACLITWLAVGERAEQAVPNRIAAILPKRTTEADIIWTMQLLAHGHAAWNPGSDNIYVSELLHFARAKRLPVSKLGFDRYLLGGNPDLLARMAYNLVVTEEDSSEVLTWEESIYPNLKPDEDLLAQVEKLLPFPRSRWRFKTATNTMEKLEGEHS